MHYQTLGVVTKKKKANTWCNEYLTTFIQRAAGDGDGEACASGQQGGQLVGRWQAMAQAASYGPSSISQSRAKG